jgi:ribosomal protein S18 acetylase RimI-like enzyme
LRMHIREFQISEYDQVLQLWKDAGLIIRPGDEREGIKLKLQRDPDLFLVAEDNATIVGVVMGAWDGRRAWIYHLAVKPDRQRKGIATALVHELERRLISKGAKKVNAQIYQDNTPSFAFFTGLGYAMHSDLSMIGKMLKNTKAS